MNIEKELMRLEQEADALKATFIRAGSSLRTFEIESSNNPVLRDGNYNLNFESNVSSVGAALAFPTVALTHIFVRRIPSSNGAMWLWCGPPYLKDGGIITTRDGRVYFDE